MSRFLANGLRGSVWLVISRAADHGTWCSGSLRHV